MFFKIESEKSFFSNTFLSKKALRLKLKNYIKIFDSHG